MTEAETRPEGPVTVQRPARRTALRPTVIVLLAIGGVAAVLGIGVGLSGGLGRLTFQPVTPRVSVTAAPTPTTTTHLTARDGGVKEFATGRATLLAPDRYRYIVHEGDTFLGIASRFHVCTYDLVTGRPPADQSAPLTAGTAITVELGNWPTQADGSIDCVWDK